jgi:hypothetical protein
VLGGLEEPPYVVADADPWSLGWSTIPDIPPILAARLAPHGYAAKDGVAPGVSALCGVRQVPLRMQIWPVGHKLLDEQGWPPFPSCCLRLCVWPPRCRVCWGVMVVAPALLLAAEHPTRA